MQRKPARITRLFALALLECSRIFRVRERPCFIEVKVIDMVGYGVAF